uniref:Hypothetical chloroplast RF20 n=1 Tax=Chloropicon maureeniae TaxID=1461542 RepID=A0A4D6C3K3_9CHLO|nr:hypothetical chloroplast RF20 [Chloropicon maureeniae]QBX98230.1 hypothetical chloroplast RF20 [Chloropicon maureeniae]
MRILQNFPWPFVELLAGFVFGSCFIVLLKPSQLFLILFFCFLESASWKWVKFVRWHRFRAGLLLGIFVDAFKVGS